MKYLLLLCFFFVLRFTASAQRGLMYRDLLSVRVSPMGLIDLFDGNLTAGAVYSLNNRISISADVSCILYSGYMELYRPVRGYIFKPGLRYYFAENRKYFVEALPFYKRAGYRIQDWLGKDAVNGVPAYEEFKKFTYRKQVLGLNIIGGVQRSLNASNRLRMEIYAGIGIRYKFQDIKDDPRAVYTLGDLFTESVYARRAWLPGIPHGLRIVYVVR